jgi:hypothetical protein
LNRLCRAISLFEYPLRKLPYGKNPLMFEQFQKASNEFQKMGKDNFDALVRSYGEMNKGFQAIGARVTDYSKRTFEDATLAFEQLIAAKSVEQAIEIQSQYAKKAYDAWAAEASRLGEMYTAMARSAYKPVERAVTKKPPSSDPYPVA